MLTETQKEELLKFATLHDIYEVEPEELADYDPTRRLRDFWIVSHWPHHQYADPRKALRAQKRLSQEYPEKEFRVYHCKRNLWKSKARETIVGLCNAIDDLLDTKSKKPLKDRMEYARELAANVRGPKTTDV